LVVFPPCKINLGLSVLSKRTDGYHDLETCFYPVPWLDILEIIRANTFSFTSSGDAIPGPEDQNLCVKAYDILKNDFDIAPVKIHLHKIIPSGAGLGGGSSNAAYTLRVLNQIFSLQLSHDSLIGYASRLGSDCAFFVQDKPMFGMGRGELLSDASISLKGKYFVLIKPNIHVSTADAFAGIIPRKPTQRVTDVVTNMPISEWRGLLKNDFEDSVFKKYPMLSTIKEKLYSVGAVYASMSGSGSSLFGIFEQEKQLGNEFPGTRYWSGFVS
jgi:4-diphosphocytidyl-2-C-methyl-D-erythritol kinase